MEEQGHIPSYRPMLRMGTAPRIAALAINAPQVNMQVQGNNQFAVDLYRYLSQTNAAKGQNLFYSPYSLSSALALLYPGAKCETAAAIQRTLHFEKTDPAFEAFNTLTQYFEQLNQLSQDTELLDFQLLVNNSIWAEANYILLADYLNRLSAYFGTGIFKMDFANQPDTSREQINDWVADKTNHRINNLLVPGIINSDTRAVLTNAIYFIASWEHEFERDNTEIEPFHLLDGSDVLIPMMNQKEKFRVVLGEGYDLIELPYIAQHATLIALLPKAGTFQEFETNLTLEKFETLITIERSQQEVELTFPKIEVESSFSVSEVLRHLGLAELFNPATANFSGITPNPDFYISNMIHKAVVKLDEKGTEAAAAAAVVAMGFSLGEPEPIVMRFDRPFIFAIINPKTKSILFLGRIMNPTA